MTDPDLGMNPCMQRKRTRRKLLGVQSELNEGEGGWIERLGLLRMWTVIESIGSGRLEVVVTETSSTQSHMKCLAVYLLTHLSKYVRSSSVILSRSWPHHLLNIWYVKLTEVKCGVHGSGVMGGWLLLPPSLPKRSRRLACDLPY